MKDTEIIHPSKSNTWEKPKERTSLSDVNQSMKVPVNASTFRKFLAFVGPGYLVAVGYMDPGNWATDIAGDPGSAIPCWP